MLGFFGLQLFSQIVIDIVIPLYIGGLFFVM